MIGQSLITHPAAVDKAVFVGLGKPSGGTIFTFFVRHELRFPSGKHEGIVTLGFISRKTFHLETSIPGRFGANDRLFGLRAMRP
jgi:hypothetical protein